MAALPRYSPSGRVRITFVPLLVAAGVAAALVALPYQYLLEWLPVVQLSLLLVVGFGLAVAVGAYFAVRIGHCRNRPVALLGGLFVAAVALAGSYFWEARRVAAEVQRPITLLQALDVKVHAGWKIGNGDGAPLNDGGVYLIWLAEGLTVLGLGLAGGYAAAATPYCEKCHAFCGEQKFGVGGVGRVQALALIADGKLGALALIDAGAEQGKSLHFDVTTCATCSDTAFLSVVEKQVTMKGVKNNKRQEKSSTLVKHAILSPADREQALMRVREVVGQKLAS